MKPAIEPNRGQATVYLILKDVNDNAPEMPNKPVYDMDESVTAVSEVTLCWIHFAMHEFD